MIDKIILSGQDLPLSFSEVQGASFVRQGGDLAIKTDEQEVVIKDYFVSAQQGLTTSDGLELSSQLISTFSGSDTGALTAATGLADNSNAIAVVDKIEGSAVAVLSDGGRITLKDGDKIPELAEIYTNKDSAVDLILKDGSLLNIGAQARLALDSLNFDPVSESGSMFIVVLRGIFSFASGLIARAEPDNVRLHTPTSEIGLRGTKIIGEVDASGDTKIGLIEGRIVVYKDGLETSMDKPFTVANFFQGEDRPEAQQLNLQSFAEQFDELSASDITAFSLKAEATAGRSPQVQDEAFDEAGDAEAEATTQRFGDIAGGISFDNAQEVAVPQSIIVPEKLPKPGAEVAQYDEQPNTVNSPNADGSPEVAARENFNSPTIATNFAGLEVVEGNTASEVALFPNGKGNIGFSDADGDVMKSIVIKISSNSYSGSLPSDTLGHFIIGDTRHGAILGKELEVSASDIAKLKFESATDYSGKLGFTYKAIDSSNAPDGKNTSAEHNFFEVSVTRDPDLPSAKDQTISANSSGTGQNISLGNADRYGFDDTLAKIVILSASGVGAFEYFSAKGLVKIAPADLKTLELSGTELSTLSYKVGFDTEGKASFRFKAINNDGEESAIHVFNINYGRGSISLSDQQDLADGYQVVDDDHMIGSSLLSDSDA